MSDIDLSVFFWTDSKGHKRVGFGNARYVTPYDLSRATNARGRNSIKDHSKYDKLSPNRYKLHNQIIRDMFEGHKPFKPGEEKVAYYTGGGSASGKGTFSKDIATYYSKDTDPIIIDPDKLKELLLKADTGLSKLDATTSTFYHVESLLLAQRIYEIALQHNYPVLMDSTATNVNFGEKLAFAKRFGYKTELRFMSADVNSVLDGSLQRFRKEGRLVPLHRILATHQMAQSVVPGLFEQADDVKLYSRSGNKISLVATGGSKKKISKVNSTLWDSFMSASAYSITPEVVAKYNAEVAKIKNS